MLLLVSVCGLAGCSKNPTKEATEIKELMSTYEANIENADFSKFTLIDNYKMHKDEDAISFSSDEEKNLIVSYDESGYLYYKNYESFKTSRGINEYSYYDTWLYIEGNNLIWAKQSEKHDNTKTNYYDVLECSSLEQAKENFTEEAFSILNDLFPNQYNKVSVEEIPTQYNLDYFEKVSMACERQINMGDVPFEVNSKSDTLLDMTIYGDKYAFENGILKSYEGESTGSSTANNGIEVVFKDTYNITISLSSDLSKPDLTKFTKIN